MGATLRCGARVSHCRGFSCCRVRALGAQASVVVACKLLVAACVWDLVPWPGIEPGPPALGAGVLTTAQLGQSPICCLFFFF